MASPPLVRGLAAVLLALVLGGSGAAEATPLARSAWTTADGLPVNNVNDVEIGRDGYVWLATFDGLVRFDGVRFRVFDTESTPGMPTNRVVSVDEAPDGALWLRTEPGFIVRFDPATGEARSWSFAVGDTPLPLILRRDGSVWSGAPGGLAHFDGKDFVQVPLKAGLIVSALAEGRDGALWVGAHGRSLARQDASGTRWYATNGDVTSIAIGPDGGVWVTTWIAALRLRGDRFVPVEVNGVPWADGFVALQPTGPDEAWVITDSGLYRWQNGTATPVDQDDRARPPIRTAVTTDDAGHTWALSRSGVFRDGTLVARSPHGEPWTDLAAAPDGGVWISSGGGGLLHVGDAAIETLGPELAPGLTGVHGLATGANGAVWAATPTGGLFRIGADGVRAWADAEGLRQNVTTVLEDPDGTVWAGALDVGIFRRVGDRFERDHGTPDGTVWMLERLRDGTLLASVGDALFQNRGGAWSRFVTDPPLPPAPIRALWEEEDGLWLGTNGAGLLHVDRRGMLTRYGRAEGFPSDAIRALWRSEAGTLWIGTEDRGLLGWVPGSAAPRALSRRDGLPDHGVHAIVPDGEGGVWGSTNRGLFRISAADLETWVRGARADVYVEPFGTGDGMADAEANGGVDRSGIRTSDGRIWFASQAGVVEVHPEAVGQGDAAAAPHVEALRFDAAEEPVAGARQIAPSERSFGVNYTALPATTGPKQRFWYRLDGVDPDWVDAGSRRTAWYTQVPPGTHTFRVRTRPPDEVAAPEATLVLNVVPRFYETAWFRAALGLAAVGVIGLLFWARLAAVQRRERVLEARVAERTADLAAEKELAQAAERTIAAQAARLAEADRLKTRFFQDLSHELRTPLTLVIGPLEDVRAGRHGAVAPAAQEQVGLAERNARRLFALVNQLLDLVRLDVGALKLERTPQDLVALVASVAEVHQPLALRRGCPLVVELPADPVLVDFDRRELEKVVANLLGNALKFTPPGGQVAVRIQAGPDEVEVAIADRGPGLSPDVRARLFERFHSPGQSDVQVGSGIGLSLARDLTERHDGRIRVESVEGQGSTFTVVLPRSRAAAAVLDMTASTPPAPELVEAMDAAETVDDRTTVLVVDDHPEVRAWIRGHLQPRYHVLEASNGREALEAARKILPDLVVSDVMMPELDGYGLIRALRADPELDTVPVVMLTAKGSDQSRVAGLRDGADVWLTKPFSSAVLVAQVDGLIAQRRLLRERLVAAAPPAPLDESLLSADERYLRKVRTAIAANLHDPAFGVQELAQAVAQDRTHLFRRVKELTGEAPSTLLLAARLERAAELLGRRVGSVGEIAYAVGFNGVSHFSKAFRDQYGVTPTAWAVEGSGGMERHVD